MKITLRHLGPIEQAEIDLRPLTVFIGRNNTGKTWATQAIGAMFTIDMHHAYINAYLDSKIPESYPMLDKAADQFIQEGNAQINWIEFVEELGETLLTSLITFVTKKLGQFIGTELADFSHIELSLDLKEIISKLRDYIIRCEVNATKPDELSLLNFTTELNSNRLYFFTNTQGSILDKLPQRAIRSFILEMVFILIRFPFFHQTRFFPTERATFINFSSYLRGNNLISDQSNVGVRAKVALPIQLFFASLKEILDTGLIDRQEQVKDNPQIATYLDLANLLETEILGGKVGIATSKSGLQKEFVFQTNGVNLEVSASSSMTKELAPLVLYLRYLAQPGELIIIDEPEMNLHPEAQVKLTEFLAMLVQAGLHVLITTHSPYMVDHLANLMAAAKHEDKTAIKEHFLLERTESFISQDKVSVYLFENGTATNVVDNEGIIHWGTFGEVSNYLSDIYAHLI